MTARRLSAVTVGTGDAGAGRAVRAGRPGDGPRVLRPGVISALPPEQPHFCAQFVLGAFFPLSVDAPVARAKPARRGASGSP